MSNFINMKQAVHKQFLKILNTGKVFTVDIDKDTLWDTYINSFLPGTNPVFRERTEHDCNCCKRYIRSAGNAVAFIDGEMITMWDVTVDEKYQPVADALNKKVKEAAVNGIFLSEFKTAGADKTPDNKSDVIWDHFFMELPPAFVKPKDDIPSIQGIAVNNYSVFKRSVTEISMDAVNAVLDLIEQKAIYKWAEMKPRVTQLKKLKEKANKAKNLEEFYWTTSLELGTASSFRNSAVGTLLVDLSEGRDIEIAVQAYEKITAPENYKRSSSVITQSMKNNAAKTIEKLGLNESIPRRHAVVSDITINDVLFADRSAKVSMGVLDLVPTTKTKEVKTDKAVDINIEDFITTVVPRADSIELLVDNKHKPNFMSLVAPVNSDSPSITKWGNNFTWSYAGELADSSMRAEVVAKGGRVDGVFRFTHSWNHDGQNQSLMDLHVFLPGSNREVISPYNDTYGNSERVGWNHRNHLRTRGVQDVDFTNPPGKNVPLENITFPDLGRMPEGTYSCKIHNWAARSNPKSGFKAEIEVNGEIYQYDYNKPLKNKEWVDVADVELKNGTFTVTSKLPTTNSPTEIYGVTTTEFKKVTLLMNSPNYWENVENPKGNKHYFFILEGCKNEDDVRGFYNEFLRDDLHNDRKVFEVLASKLKVPFAEEQLTGLGFSETQTNEVIVRVRGEVNNMYNIKFNK